MKTPNYLLLVCLVALAAATSLAGLMRASERSARPQSCLSQIPTDYRDTWDDTASDMPPLAPGAAMRIAKNYVLRVRVPDNTEGWVLDSIALHRMSFFGSAEEWVYLANFKSAPRSSDEDSVLPPVALQLPVRFDGTVPPGLVPQVF